MDEHTEPRSGVVWQLGRPTAQSFDSETDGSCHPHFALLTAPFIRVDADNTAAEALVPRRLTADCRKFAGAECLEIDMRVLPGRYTLQIDVLETVKSDFCTVSLDGYEIGAFGIPFAGDPAHTYRNARALSERHMQQQAEHTAIKSRYHLDDTYAVQMRRLRPFRFELPLVIAADGRHTLSLRCHASAHSERQDVYVGDGFSLICLALAEGMKEAEPSLRRPFPGQPLIDLWGWMSMTSFDHPGNRETSPERLIARALREPGKWGANNFELLPVHRDGVLFDFTDDPAWVNSVGYEQSLETEYTNATIASILGQARKHGMLNTLFFYSLYGANFIERKLTSVQRQQLAERLFARWMDAADGARPRFDAMSMEAWVPFDAPAFQQLVWRWNPGLCLLMSSGAAGGVPEAQAYGYTPGLHAYNAHWQGPLCYQTGFDLSHPLQPYPPEAYETQWGTTYFYMQGCGQSHHPRRLFPLLRFAEYGITNRTAAPDWIVAQAHQFAYRRWMNPHDRLASAVCWEADEETMAPDETRVYVYAASQDPIRLAVAGQLTDTGLGGELAMKHSLKKAAPGDTTRVRPRHRYPASTHFIQNNHLQMLVFADREYNSLQCDLQRAGCYYNSGALVELAFPMCATRFADNRFLRQQATYPEPAGPKAILREESELGSLAMTIRQTRTIEMFADCPGLRIRIERRLSHGQGGTVDTVMSFRGHDVIVVGDKTYSERLELQGTDGGEPIRLIDSRGVLPDVVIGMQGTDAPERLVWLPGSGLEWSHALYRSHCIDISLVVPDGMQRDWSSELLLAMLCEVDGAPAAGDPGTAALCRNTLPAPSVKVVQLPSVGDGPYMVRERGWWRVRGASPSRTNPGMDRVKVYADGGEEVPILPAGYVEGIVKPGWGCQHVLAIRDASRQAACVQFTVHVDGVTPLLFAPRVELCSSVGHVWVNGKEWHYQDGSVLYLPNRPGMYAIEAANGAVGQTPHLLASYALISETSWRDGIFRFRADHPLWTRKTGEDFRYTAIIDPCGRKAEAISNGTLLDVRNDKLVLAFEPGEVSVKLH